MIPRAVTFDFWNTLVREDRDKMTERAEAWERILADAGHRVADHALEAAMAAGWSDYQRHWVANIPFGAPEVIDVLLVELGIAADQDLRTTLLEVITDPPMETRPSLNPGVAEVLETLATRDVRIGIVCDVGLTPSRVLRRYLEVENVSEYFTHTSFSDEVGVYKPDAKIFRHALEGLGGISPDRAAHVGDLRRTDVFGAQAMGMTTVRYAGVHDDPAMPDAPVIEADHVIDEHLELLEVLGLS